MLRLSVCAHPDDSRAAVGDVRLENLSSQASQVHRHRVPPKRHPLPDPGEISSLHAAPPRLLHPGTPEVSPTIKNGWNLIG